MTDSNPLALARDLCSRATPYRLLARVAGLAFNFSLVDVTGSRDEHVLAVEPNAPPLEPFGAASNP